MNIDDIRAELPVLERAAYLNTGTFGPLPRRTAAAMDAEGRSELVDGRSGAAYWQRRSELRARARAAIGALIGSAPECVALTRATTDGCNIVVAGLRLGPGDEIVTTDAEHFGLLGPLHVSGGRVRVARVQDRPAAEALAAIEAEITAKTRLIAVSHVAWSTGQVLPVRELAGRGIPVLVDGAQGAGAIPVDVARLGCDFYTVSGQKWLLGPDATGALYVHPDRLGDLAVAFPSYYAQQRYEADGAFVPAATAQRYEPGTISAPSLAGLLVSLEFAAEAGEERFERARLTADRCLELLTGRVEVVSEPGNGTLVSFVAKGDAAETVVRLATRGVVVRDLPHLGWVRASVGFWTSDDDLERLADAL